MKRLKKDLLLLAAKLIEKIAYSSNGNEYYNSYLKRKKYKIGKTMKNNYSATKSYRKNSNIVDIKSVLIKYPKNSHKSSKIIRNLSKDDFKYLSQEFDSNVPYR